MVQGYTNIKLQANMVNTDNMLITDNYEMLCRIQGSFHQGDNEVSSKTMEAQSSCMVLFVTVYSNFIHRNTRGMLMSF